MEFQRAYTVDMEMPRYKHWQETGDIDWEYHLWWIEYMQRLRDEGKSVRRIKVVDEPLNDYWKFTYAQTGRLNAAGDATRWCNRQEMSHILVPPTDFYVLDGREVMFLHFGGDLQPSGYTVSENPELVAAATSAFNTAWDFSTPHDDYKPRNDR
nr:DUF6879 family protein [Pilimelia terevasa]